ncbi:MAG TPA: alpha-hydroxy-acid oxidizing protein [Pseudonocardiaceae bacterium]|nr:alpha-hydroxy-acid oxidizing protein [Pseudonocardiaceae bacterium]
MDDSAETGGRAGVDRAIAILRDQIQRTMKLLGVAGLEQLEPRHVTQLVRPAPPTETINHWLTDPHPPHPN